MAEVALAGVRIIDATSGIAGPLAVQLLAEQGAEVIKVEPIGGDRLRSAPGGSVWLRGRRSIAVDLGSDDGRCVLRDLCASADVLVESFSPRTVDRLGIDLDELGARFPRLIIASCPAYPPGHRFEHRPGWDALVQARLGMQNEQPGWRDGPTFLHFPAPSMGAAFLLAAGLLAALLEREASGVGQRVQTSLYQGGMAYTTQIWVDAERSSPFDHLMMGKSYPPGVHQISLYECANGEWIHAAAMSGRTPTRSQDEILGLEPLEPLAAFSLSPAQRQEREESIRAAFRRRSRQDLLEEFHAAGLGAEAVLAPSEVLDHPQLIANGMSVAVEDPVLGTVRQIGVPIHLRSTPGRVGDPRPAVGSDTRAVLDGLGYTTETINDLVGRGVVGVNGH